SEIPCPCGEHESYADHFLEPFLSALESLQVKPEVLKIHELYKHGMYKDVSLRALKMRSTIASILAETSGREIPENWYPFMVRCPVCGRFTTTNISAINDNGDVDFTCSCGNSGTVDLSSGKLVWRVDWPARWKVFGVTVEPFGKDHATAGGSYDTGVRISREVFDYEPPYPVIYEWITLNGTPMSSSKGVAVTVNDMLEVAPPDVLRYMFARVKPEKHIEFNPSTNFLQLVDEFEAQAKDSRETFFSHVGPYDTGIPFRHMLTVVQIAHNERELFDVLQRSGYAVEGIEEAILSIASNARTWVEKYAPEHMRFSIQKTLPSVTEKLENEQKLALSMLADWLERTPESNQSAEEVHAKVYEIAENLGIKANKVFKAIYLSLLGKPYGPRAGFFLVSLDKEFLITRLREAAGIENDS
ncbi:MAG: lysine--tRNA ligase, partial [Methermicoccaceae archaeon]